MRFTAIALSAALALGSVMPSVAAPWKLDKSHSQITFSVSHLGFSLVNGMFGDFDADIDFDPENVEATKVRFVIDAGSVTTFWDARDNHLRSKDFLDVEEFPQIVFESTKFELTSAETATVTGNLTIRGVTHEQSFEARLNKIGPNPFNAAQQIAGFAISGEIERTKFGVKFGAPAIGAVIPVNIDIEINPAN